MALNLAKMTEGEQERIHQLWYNNSGDGKVIGMGTHFGYR